ncbi:MAG TPA: hypothetical protein VKA84_24140 [Gemmatimonadaceae bacterium]|nr:hypothetical protein [Gemmatimonadaceae bacterium]
MRQRTGRRLLTLAAIALVGAASGCGAPTAATEADALTPEPISADQPEYTVTRGVDGRIEITIGLRYVNRTGATTYLPVCGGVHPPALQKLVRGEWVAAYSPFVDLCLQAPVEVRPGKSYRYSYRVLAWPQGGWSRPYFEIDEIAGTYRAVWTIYETWTPGGPEPGLGRLAPLEGRVSNEFRIVE